MFLKHKNNTFATWALLILLIQFLGIKWTHAHEGTYATIHHESDVAVSEEVQSTDCSICDFLLVPFIVLPLLLWTADSGIGGFKRTILPRKIYRLTRQSYTLRAPPSLA